MDQAAACKERESFMEPEMVPILLQGPISVERGIKHALTGRRLVKKEPEVRTLQKTRNDPNVYF